jgi:NADH:ubiquinone reductase (H+-translocating)
MPPESRAAARDRPAADDGAAPTVDPSPKLAPLAPKPGAKARPRVVILGAGFGGLSAAMALRRAPVEVVVIDRRNHHLFQPLLYQVATATLQPAEIAVPIRRVLRRQANTEVLLGEVLGIDPDRQRVSIDGLQVDYDYLVVATGSAFSYFGHPEWAEHAPGLKSIEDALTIRRRVLLAFERAETALDEEQRRRHLTFVIVGGGPTGVELAGAITDMARNTLAPDFRRFDPRKARIVLVEAAPRLLGSMPEDLADYARRALGSIGVEVKLDCMVESVDERGVVAGGERIEADTVIWGAGVAPSPVGEWLGVETDKGGRIAVGPDLSLPGRPEVFVIGDAALALDPHGKPLPGLAAVAQQQGKFVGRLIAGLAAGEENRPRFRYRNWGELATVGRQLAVADFGWIKLKGWLAWWLWGAVHIFYLIGFGNRIMVMLEWLWAYLTFRRGARLITGPAR